MLDSSFKEKTLSSVFWSFFQRCGGAVASFVVQIAMARLLTPDDFGLLAIMFVFINLSGIIATSGLTTALVQNKDLCEEDYSTVFWLTLFLSSFFYVIIFFAAPAIGTFYGSDAIVFPLRVLAIVLVVNCLNSVQNAIVSRELAFRKFFSPTIVSVVFSGAVGVTCAICGAGLWALVFQQMTSSVVKFLVMRLQVVWVPALIFQPHRAKILFKFGWKLLVSGLLDTGYQSLSDLIIGKQFSTAELGLVSQGKKYPFALGNVIGSSIQPVMLSAVSRVQEDIAQVKRLVRRALKTTTFLIVPIMGFLAIAAEPFVSLLIGEKWLSCVPFLQMYCFICALLPIHVTNLQALNGMGRSDLFLRLEIIKKVIGMAILSFTAFVLQSIYAIIAGYMFTSVLSSFINAFPNKKIIGYSYGEQVRDIAPAFALAILSSTIAVAIKIFELSSLLTLVLQLFTVFGIYFGLAHAFHLESFEYLFEKCRATVRVRLGRGVQ